MRTEEGSRAYATKPVNVPTRCDQSTSVFFLLSGYADLSSKNKSSGMSKIYHNNLSSDVNLKRDETKFEQEALIVLKCKNS